MKHGEKAVIVVLGGALRQDRDGCWRTTHYDESDHGGSLGDYIRVIAAGYLAKENSEHSVIASGGKDNPHEPFISEVIKAELIRKGVPVERIVEERNSCNTYQQLREVERIVLEEGNERLLLLSNRYHLPRIQAFLEEAPTLCLLRRLFEGGFLTLQSAEEILLDRDPEIWKPVIDAAYQSKAMQQRIENESKGVRQIKEGTYHYK